MKDGPSEGEKVDGVRQDLYGDYVNWYLQQGSDVRPCRDVTLLKKAARYLKDPEPKGTFKLFPFYQILREGSRSLGSDCRRHVTAFIKASDMLEMICVNLFLQPWRKEIKTIKTFTGPFVYSLLPVLNRSTIRSVLTSIGYRPQADTPQSEYRLSEDANPDRAMMVGFELLLARVECYQLLELLDKDQLEPKELLEVLHRRWGPTKPEEPAEKKTVSGHKEEEEEEEKEEECRTEAPPYLNTGSAVNPEPEPRHYHLPSGDHSVIEMQMIYPDLAFRGRRLIPYKTPRANMRKGRNQALHPAGMVVSKSAKLPRRDVTRDIKAAAAAAAADIPGENDDSKASEVSGDDNGGGTGRTTGPADTVSSSSGCSDGLSVDDEVGPTQTVSLHITLRTGSTAGDKLKSEAHRPTAVPPARRQQQNTAEHQSQGEVTPRLPSANSTEEEEEQQQVVGELVERMGRLHVNVFNEELKRKGGVKVEEENKFTRKKVRKASARRGTEKLKLTRSALNETPSVPDVSADGQRREAGGSGQLEGDRKTGGGEEEQLTEGYVIL